MSVMCKHLPPQKYVFRQSFQKIVSEMKSESKKALDLRHNFRVRNIQIIHFQIR